MYYIEEKKHYNVMTKQKLTTRNYIPDNNNDNTNRGRIRYSIVYRIII